MKIPCQCSACLVLIDLALTLRAIGATEEAEIVARSVSWIPDDSEGYADTWSAPIAPSDPEMWN